MRIRLNGSQLVVTLLMAATAATISGCDLASGAHFKPSVTYKPSTTGGEAAETTKSESTGDAPAASEGVGTLRGKVEISGTIAPLPPLYAKGADVKDAAVCSAVEAPDETILVKDGKLANVFIYLKKAPKTVPAAPTDKLIFDQKHCQFKPHAMYMRVGQAVSVLNSDAVAHNTHTYGKKTTAFNSIVSPNEAVGVALIYKQAEQEPISVGCDIHPWMKAYHLPIDHPYVAVTGEDGTFEIKDIPAGKHEFKVWHEAGKLLEKAKVVTIKPGDNELTITVTPSQLGK